MSAPEWNPRGEISRREAVLLKRTRRHRKLFGFLREVRTELFDAAFQRELIAMYRGSGQGRTPVPPALLAMATLLQAYVGVSDAEAVELALVDARWQMVLDVLDAEDPPFSQGALQTFRERLIMHDMDRRLLERTVEFARKSKGFDWSKLPKTLRLAIDSRPLEGAARVDDTVNLLGRAARKLLACVAKVADLKPDVLARKAQAPLLASSVSVKAALDADWGDPEERADALNELVDQIESLEAWVREHFEAAASEPPMSEHLATLAQLKQQDLEPDPSGGGVRVRDGVAKDRRISVEDSDMRHGRKTRSQTVNGYKSHLAADLDAKLILACAVTPANQPEKQALPAIKADISRYARSQIAELQVDRGYLASPLVRQLASTPGVEVICKPRKATNASGLFPKARFKSNLVTKKLTCPADVTIDFQLGRTVQFPAASCHACDLRALCTNAALGRGRSITISADEPLLKRLTKAASTPVGRARLRERTKIEHRLAHHARKQGRRARYRGTRKNVFDARRCAAVVNLEVVHQQLAKAA